MGSTYEHIDVHKVGGDIGAEIAGRPDRRRPRARGRGGARGGRCSATGSCFLRDQHHVDDDQRAFAELLGTLTKPHPTVAGDGAASCRSTPSRARPTAGTRT